VAALWYCYDIPNHSSVAAMHTLASSRAEWYRAKAAECEQRAEEMHDEDAKLDFIKLARDWTYLAKQVERQEW
jgi:hypothetical protein